jgi:GntR family transcriptional regulator/MocR family aminotransferase
MARWDFALEIDRRRGTSVVRQIAGAIVAEIQRGRLRPGDRVAGSRTLARTLHVHRQTVVSAIEELIAEGWLVSRRASGTFVAPQRPEPRPKRFAEAAASRRVMPARFAIPLPAAPEAQGPIVVPTGAIFMSGSRPDTRLLPADLVGRAYRRALRTHGAELLSYGDPAGLRRLREGLAAMLSATRGLAVDARSILLTRGSQMALSLTARALIRPGDAVAVEDPGYRFAWEAFRLAGAEILPAPVDEHGVNVDALAQLTRQRTIRALYVTPHRQFPTTVTLPPARRVALLQLAAREHFAIVEDDYDHEFHYDGRPVLPLASADRDGLVIYVGTWSKVLAPALRLGFLVAPPDLVDQLVAYRSLFDVQGDPVLECALADLLDEGLIQRHVRKVKRIYHARRDALVAALRRELGDFLAFSVPSGGTAVWVRTRNPRATIRWIRRARELGVLFDEVSAGTVAGAPLPGARVGFAGLAEDEMRLAVSRLADAARLPGSALR